MKANASPAMTSQNYDALADMLDQTVAFAPAGYAHWASIARDGADAARVQNLDAVKASCRSCHNQYRGRYKAEMRARPLPP
jgi:cytochrome c556